MDLSLSAEQHQIRDAVRRLAERELRPMAAAAEAAEAPSRDYFAWAGRNGLLGINFPRECGGQGLDKLTAVLVVEELARVNSGIAGSLMLQSGVTTEAILRHGTQEQKERYLPATFRGEKIASLAITEPDTGSDIANLGTIAEPSGSGYRLRGAKVFCSNATLADYILVMARVPGTVGRSGLSLFIVDGDNPGLVRGKPIKKLGHRSADTGQFALDDAYVDASAIIGESGKGMKYVQQALTAGRLDFIARTIGVTQEAFEQARRYARERKQFGNPIAKLQAIRFKLARMAMELEACRGMLHKAAWLYDTGESADQIVAMAKLFSAEVAQRVTWEALQIHGAYGYTREFEIERLFRDARLFSIPEGTNEILHVMIARGLDLD